jgi:hypothetical protein
MYVISEKWYGYLLCDNAKELDESMQPFLADLCKMIDDVEGPDFWGNGSDDKPERIDYATASVQDLFEELNEVSVFNTSYSGDGKEPYGIAIDVESFPSWDIRDVIKSEENNESQRTETELKFRQYCNNMKSSYGYDFVGLFERHGITPDFLWTTSTS